MLTATRVAHLKSRPAFQKGAHEPIFRRFPLSLQSKNQPSSLIRPVSRETIYFIYSHVLFLNPNVAAFSETARLIWSETPPG